MFDTHYWFWDSILPAELCDALILEGDKLISSDGVTGHNSIGNGVYDPKIRETNISFFETYHWIHGICTHYADIANRNSGWNLDLSYAQNVQYARYFPEQHYIPHSDDRVKSGIKEMRKLSVSIQISDPNNYEGGDFIIQSPNSKEFEQLTKFRNRGSILVFPSVVEHGVLPIIRGVRHSIVCWIVGPSFR